MDWVDFAVMLFIYMLGFGAISRAARKVEEMGSAALLIIAVYSLILILLTIFAIATRYLPLWAILLATLLCAAPYILNRKK